MLKTKTNVAITYLEFCGFLLSLIIGVNFAVEKCCAYYNALHVCCTYATRMVHVCCTYATRMLHLCYTYAARMLHVCCTYVTRILKHKYQNCWRPELVIYLLEANYIIFSINVKFFKLKLVGTTFLFCFLSTLISS